MDIIDSEAVVEDVRDVASDSKTIRLRLTEVDAFPFEAGQFVMVRMNEDRIAKAYSISSAPHETGYIEITVRATGEFSGMLCSLRGGETLRIKGPYGRMVLPEGHDGPFVFVAGGSGIAPFLSILSTIREKKLPNPTHLFYSVKVPEQFIAYDTLRAWATGENMHFRFSITQPDAAEGWTGRTGRFSVDQLKEEVSGFQDSQFFLCGPPSMVMDMKAALIDEGIARERIANEQW